VRVSLFAMQKMKNARGVIDTACTFEEQFERPWQPLKGISIKHICVLKFFYPTTTKLFKTYLKGSI
jgi:hypothetical protein